MVMGTYKNSHVFNFAILLKSHKVDACDLRMRNIHVLQGIFGTKQDIHVHVHNHPSALETTKGLLHRLKIS